MREGTMLLQMALNEQDLLKVQAAFPDGRLELRDGKIIVMSPSDDMSEIVAFELAARLREWVRPRKLGFVFTSSAGFRLPNGDIVSPDVSYFAKERMRRVSRAFAAAVPNLAVEVKSPSDRISDLDEKLALLRSFGTQVALLVDPDEQVVKVHAEGQPSLTLTDADTLELPIILPGWSMPVSELWPPQL
jgi:Uma2 family endonuclease